MLHTTEATEPAHRYRWVIMGVLWTAYIVVFLHRLSIAPLAPFFIDEMGLSRAQVGSLISAASFGYMLSLIPAGWATDRLGIRWLLLIGELVGGFFILGMFLVPSYESALVIMAMAGFGCGCLMPVSTKGVLLWFPKRERATVMGLKQTAINIGGIITGTTLPTIAIALGWRYGFLFLGILAIAIGIVSFFLYRDPPLSPAPAVGPSAAPPGTRTPAGSHALRQLFRRRDIWLVAFAAFSLVMIDFSVAAHLVLYLKEVLGLPVVVGGMVLAMTEAGGAIGKPASGIISDRFFGSSRRRVFMLWGAIDLAALLVLAFWGARLSWALYPLLLLLGITGLGWGGLNLTLIAELAGTELAGMASSIVAAIMMAGVTIGPVLFGYIVDTTGSYQLGWLYCATAAAVSLVVLFFVREERRVI